MMLVHVVARAARPSANLCDPQVAPLLWAALRRAFPAALACVLMPDHLHIIVRARSPAEARKRLGAVLSGLRRSARARAIHWQRVPPPAVIADLQHAARQVRYAALNPCRRGLAADPLGWLWSTHRDVLGAVVDPWVTGTRLAEALARDGPGFAASHHRYVSGDPSVDPTGTPAPTPLSLDALPFESLADVLAAVAAAARGHPADVCRRSAVRELFVSVARWAHGADTARLSAITGLSPRSVRRRPLPTDAELQAVRMCLGDARLRACCGSTARDVVRAALAASAANDRSAVDFGPMSRASPRTRPPVGHFRWDGLRAAWTAALG